MHALHSQSLAYRRHTVVTGHITCLTKTPQSMNTTGPKPHPKKTHPRPQTTVTTYTTLASKTHPRPQTTVTTWLFTTYTALPIKMAFNASGVTVHSSVTWLMNSTSSYSPWTGSVWHWFTCAASQPPGRPSLFAVCVVPPLSSLPLSLRLLSFI